MNKDILIIGEIYENSLHRIVYELLGKARELAKVSGASISVLLMCLPDFVCPNALGECGADKVYLMRAPAFEIYDENLLSRNAALFIEEHQPATVLYGATSFGRALAPRVAARLGTGLTADCTEIIADRDGRIEQIRPAFADNILAGIVSTSEIRMATVRYKEFPEAEALPGRCAKVLEVAPYETACAGLNIEQVTEIALAGIEEAEIVVAGGRAIKCASDMAMLQELADAIGGKVAVSRALVDAGIAPGSIQVGYSGHRVKPKIYIACGISGAPQHLAGMRDAEVIVAINSDPAAPIFEVANYGFVGDIYEIVPQLTAMFAQAN